MKTIKIRFSELTHLGNTPFTVKANGILQGFQRHISLFPSPTISISALESEIKKLEKCNAIADGVHGSSYNRFKRSVQRSVVYDMLVLNGQYAIGIANLKETYEEKIEVLHMVNYPVAHASRTTTEMIPVTGLSVEASTIPGIRIVKLRWKKGKCDAFLLEGTQEDASSPDTKWQQLTVVAKPRCALTLPPGKWAVRVIGIYNAGQAEPSNNISFILG